MAGNVSPPGPGGHLRGPAFPGLRCVCVTGSPRKPRPLLGITGPERTEARPSHPSQEKDSGGQEAAQNQSKALGSFGNTTLIPRTSEPELSPTFLEFPASGRGAALRFQESARKSWLHLRLSLEKELGTLILGTGVAGNSILLHPTSRVPEAVVTLPGPRLNNARTYLLPRPSGRLASPPPPLPSPKPARVSSEVFQA
ncbi:unnamed protein product [Rangifer tarandus platyrhynchus]|nr:unnamed protein product [Rangifer tarandus platyrhynchus]CAI9708140.1 unnamed protein product [Rangifer tarandus platyrhynchus]